MNSALVDHYRCPESLAVFKLLGQPSRDRGYFRFGADALCYGSCARGFRTKRPAQTQYDALRDVATHGRTVQLPFDPSEIVENLRYERYVSRGHGSRHAAAVTSGVRKAYYLARPFVPASVRRRLQRMYLRDWGRLPFPDWPVDPTVERIFERLLLLSLRAQAIDCIPFIWFWPDGHPSCAIVTHDVEMPGGRDFCSQVMDLDDAYRIKSSFQLVPEGRYAV